MNDISIKNNTRLPEHVPSLLQTWGKAEQVPLFVPSPTAPSTEHRTVKHERDTFLLCEKERELPQGRDEI